MTNQTTFLNLRRVLAVLLILALPATPLWGCATPHALHRWNRSGTVHVRLHTGELAMPAPSFRWEHSLPGDDDEWSGDGLVSGAETLAPPLDSCDQVEMHIATGIQPPRLIEGVEGVSFLYNGAVSDEVREQMLGMMADDSCFILLTPGTSEDGKSALLNASTRSTLFYTADLGRTRHPGWAWVLPAAVIYDAAVGVFVAMGAGAAALLAIAIAESDEPKVEF